MSEEENEPKRSKEERKADELARIREAEQRLLEEFAETQDALLDPRTERADLKGKKIPVRGRDRNPDDGRAD